jgi:hypothetical protein
MCVAALVRTEQTTPRGARRWLVATSQFQAISSIASHEKLPILYKRYRHDQLSSM